MYYHIGLFGQPGASKSTCGLSAPGVEQHVWGSSEDLTAINFTHRNDILKPIKWDWMEFLDAKEKEKLFNEATPDTEADDLKVLATARKVKKYRRYIMQLKSDLMEGKRPELKSVFLDNGTSFFDEFKDYVNIVHKAKFITSGGNYDSIKFSMTYFDEVMNFLEMFNSLPCHTIISFHVEMTVDQETSAKVDFMNDAKNKVKHAKEFNPMITGKVKYALPGKFDFAFFLYTEENPGQPNKYIAKLEADSSNVGIAKGRIQPFDVARRIELPKGTFFDFLDGAVKKKIAGNQASK